MTGAASLSSGSSGARATGTLGRRGLGFAGVLLGVLLLPACTSDNVTPVEPASNATQDAQDGKARNAPHPAGGRPAELSMAGVDPCSLFSDAQLDDLKVNSRPRLTQSPDGRTCALDVDYTAPYYSYYVQTILDADLREWTAGERAKPSVTTSETITVAGYPAVTEHASADVPTDCEAYVSVAGGQTLRTQVVPTAPDDFSQTELCDLAAQAAEFAVQTLQTTR